MSTLWRSGTKSGATSFPIPPTAETGSSPAECLQSYLREIAGLPLLAPPEERRLARRAARGDADARRGLVSANLRLVVKVAARYARYGVPLCDLIQEGNLGLITAAERFDWQRGTRFSTYATYWIREAVIRALTAGSHAVRLSGHAFKRFRALADKADALAAEFLREPTMDEIAAAANARIGEVSRILAAAAFPVSLDGPSDDTGGFAPLDEVACECECNPAEILSGDLTPQHVRHAVDALLNPRERWVITRSFDLDGNGPVRLKDMAAELGVSLERVRQIREGALLKLRRHLISRSAVGGEPDA